MGKGDIKSFRGKLFKGSFGKYRSRKKKKLKRRHKVSKLVICDTNIFYGFGDGSIKFPDINKYLKFCVNQINLEEFTQTFTLLNNETLVRSAIQSSFKYHKVERFDPPIIYLKHLSDKTYYYNLVKEQREILEFTSKIANGSTIIEDKKEEYRIICEKKKRDFNTAAAIFNEEANKMIQIKKNKGKQQTTFSIKQLRELINLIVKNITKDHGLLDTFNWKKIELFENTIKEFLFELETGAKKVKSNDWYDLFQLIYVQPGEKYWTRDKYWIELIKKAGMNKYLYEN